MGPLKKRLTYLESMGSVSVLINVFLSPMLNPTIILVLFVTFQNRVSERLFLRVPETMTLVFPEP